LPNNLDNSFKALEMLASIDTNLTISLMNQYCPLYQANLYPEINRELSHKEFEKVFQYLLKLGFKNGWVQELESRQRLIPDFAKESPFNNIY
jgi:putative pyruvate formate lyase activating enzyme